MRTSIKIFLGVTVVGVLALLAGLGVLIWWLVAGRHAITTTILIEGNGLGNIPQTAGLTRLGRAGEMFWWFYPTTINPSSSRPIVLWLDGVTGLPPSLLANFAMIGPLDLNLNNRSDSWVNEYNLLFIDAPLGTGFSTAASNNWIPTSLEENIDHLIHVLQAFYTHHEEYQNSPLFVFGEGHGAQLALSTAIRLTDSNQEFSPNIQGVVLANGIISPALALARLGFYLEEMGYVDAAGRRVIEDFTGDINNLVANQQFEDAFDKFLELGTVVNEEAGSVAVNLGNIVDKLTQDDVVGDYSGRKRHLQSALGDIDLTSFMLETVAPALGLASTFDSQRGAAIQAFRSSFMVPAVDKVEYILANTNLKVAIYNGNLDAVSPTLGQQDWVDNLQWSGIEEFKSRRRQTLVVNSLVQGYFKETQRLSFYWVNAAGQSVPLDSPEAVKRVVRRIIDNV